MKTDRLYPIILSYLLLFLLPCFLRNGEAIKDAAGSRSTTGSSRRPDGVRTALCTLDLEDGQIHPTQIIYDANPESAFLRFSSDYQISNKSFSLYFNSKAISGAAAVYVNSIGIQTKEKRKDYIDRDIIQIQRRLPSPTEWISILRSVNLQLSVALSQQQTSKALFIINLSADEKEIIANFISSKQQVNTLLTMIAWALLPEVSVQLKYLLSRVEAFVFVDVPPLLLDIRSLLYTLLHHITLISNNLWTSNLLVDDLNKFVNANLTYGSSAEDRSSLQRHSSVNTNIIFNDNTGSYVDTDNPVIDAAEKTHVKGTNATTYGAAHASTNASTNAAANAAAAAAATAANSTETAATATEGAAASALLAAAGAEIGTPTTKATAAATAAAGVSSFYKPASSPPRLHMSTVGDVYYLKRFIRVADMLDIYTSLSHDTSSMSSEQQQLHRYLDECILEAFITHSLHYPIDYSEEDITRTIAFTVRDLKKALL